MKKIVVALITFFALAQGAFAADAAPANAAAVRELLDSMNYRATWKAMMDQMSKSLPNVIRQQAEGAIKADPGLNDAQRQEKLQQLATELPKMAEVLNGVLNDPAVMTEMEGEMVALYSRHFSAAELKQIAAYYRTPVGKKSLQVMPQVMAESMAISQRVTGPRIQKAMEQFRNK